MNNTLLITEPTQLQAIIKSAINEALQGFTGAEKQGTPSKKWLTSDEVKDLLDISGRTLQHLRDTRQIPFSQHGRKILYPFDGINQFLCDNLIKKGNK